MRKMDGGKLLTSAIAEVLQEGSVAVPGLLLKAYPQLKLSDTEAMLLIHLMAFVEKEKNDFPTIEEIQSSMAAAPEVVIRALQRLLNDQWISIDAHVDPQTGIHSERYNLAGTIQKLAQFAAERSRSRLAAEKEAAGGSDLYSLIEREFGRPLTPMELETITNWLDHDRYGEDLILTALKEAVFAGKVHFRYIDRILLEWDRNKIKTPDQAKEFTQKFRGSR